MLYEYKRIKVRDNTLSQDMCTSYIPELKLLNNFANGVIETMNKVYYSDAFVSNSCSVFTNTFRYTNSDPLNTLFKMIELMPSHFVSIQKNL